MIMTRESDYGVRILRALADGRKMTVPQICEIESVPVPFAYKILKKLSKVGYVEIYRGADGGCRLLADLNNVTLYDFLNNMGEEIIVNACLKPGFVCKRNGDDGDLCNVHKNLQVLQGVLEQALKERSLAQMVKEPQQ